MTSSAEIHIVSPAEFDQGTAQTSGSERRAAIAPALGVASAIWGGLFEVEPESRTGIHHHGEQETIAYVLSGICEVRWGATGEFRARAKFSCCAPAHFADAGEDVGDRLLLSVMMNSRPRFRFHLEQAAPDRRGNAQRRCYR